MKRSQSQFRNHVQDCLNRAEILYEVSFGRVTVTFDLKGTTAAKAAYHIRNGKKFYFLRFNKEAIKLDWDMMVNSTIAHEVAHLVAFAKPSLKAIDHNRAWKMISISLGDRDKGASCHTLPLEPVRKRLRFIYTVAGNEFLVTGDVHRKIQKNMRQYACPKTKTKIMPEHYTGHRSI